MFRQSKISIPRLSKIFVSPGSRDTESDDGRRVPSRGDLLPAVAEPHADGGRRADEVTRDT